MKAPNITPGPWRYSKENGSPTTGLHMIAGEKPGYLAEVRDCGSAPVEANAQAIAAVPDMLEALLLALRSDGVSDGVKAVIYMALRKAGCTE